MKKILIALLIFSVKSFSQTPATLVKSAMSEGIYKSFSGQAFIKKTESKSLLLFFATKDGGGTLFDKSILIETASADKSIEIGNDDWCEVFIPQSRKYILINNITKQKIVFVGLYDVENVVSGISNKLTGQNLGHNFMGYGLSYMENNWDKNSVIRQTTLIADEILLKANNSISASLKESASNAVKGGVTCHSGGVGSSECSVEQGFPTTQVCSVSCNAGYYACCNTSTFTCKCIVSGTLEK